MAGRRWLRQLLGRLRHDQRGNAAMVFGLCALPLVAGAGLAIDSLLAYSVEDQLQKSLDAAGLAAGRTALPEDVETDARSYFNTNFNSGPGLANLDADDLQIEVSEVGDELVLSATAVMPTRFMRVFGQDTVTVAATTVINREIRQMELALVLDNTGSMAGAPFNAMQAAALDLVDIVYGDQDVHPNLMTAVVPFVASVNMGNQRISWLAATDRVRTDPNAFAPSPQGWKGCVMARPSPFDETDDPPAVQPFSSFLYPLAVDNVFGPPKNPVVRETPIPLNTGYGPNLSCGPPITPLLASKTAVRAALNGMAAWGRGGTTGNLGMAWGWRVLSPRWRGLWGGATPNDRPFDYDVADTDKVVVMLTDGVNQGNVTSGQPGGSDFTAYGRLYDFAGAGATRQQGVNILDAKMSRTCTTMKSNAIIIYTIYFGGGLQPATRTLLTNCASRPEFFFPAATNASLRTVFRTIGVQLSNLRIAQ